MAKVGLLFEAKCFYHFMENAVVFIDPGKFSDPGP
jgi:hypothetical protein